MFLSAESVTVLVTVTVTAVGNETVVDVPPQTVTAKEEQVSVVMTIGTRPPSVGITVTDVMTSGTDVVLVDNVSVGETVIVELLIQLQLVEVVLVEQSVMLVDVDVEQKVVVEEWQLVVFVMMGPTLI